MRAGSSGGFHRRRADAAGDGLDRVRHGVVSGHAIWRDRAGGRRYPLSCSIRPGRADRRLCRAQWLAGAPKSELPRIAQPRGAGFISPCSSCWSSSCSTSSRRAAPFYATALLLVINQLVPRWRFNLATAIDVVTSTGRGLAELVAILLGAGLIIGPFTVTGLAMPRLPAISSSWPATRRWCC